ncbi:P1 family peptidase [Paraburkholderia sp.]|uniref:DmpA family aminopeptidase n=1 Tax=Paraburkholderia sp. TaxID=1926495 RepID=UPI002D44D580|nr:P1 family peptidase [Paraburkholderia sp.]HZZ05584.1 P1 family peptidase [Paraburkholderia sp.]
MGIRDIGVRVGHGTPGPFNSITDVQGVRVGHRTLVENRAEVSIRTGVTIIEPRAGIARFDPCFAGCHVLNGNGDATGLEWIRESGLLSTPIAYTNTHSVGVVRDALVAAERAWVGDSQYWCMPVVLETFDGVLNDIWGQHVTATHVHEAQAQARSGPVAEGSVGGGTGMICHEFKGGIGTASRRLAADDGGWCVGALVQANYGRRDALRVAGYPVGEALRNLPSPFDRRQAGVPGMGSIVVTLATDAPLLPHQCEQLARRAGIGLARVGGGTEYSSGDIFIAFSVGNRGIPPADYGKAGEPVINVRSVSQDFMSALFVAAAEAVEEAILNALVAAEDMDGRGVHVASLGTARLLKALEQVGWRHEADHADRHSLTDSSPLA